jgi:hypothetical protein
MDARAFDATRFVRLVLRSIVFYILTVALLSIAMVKPAHASGTVSAITRYYGGSSNSDYNCNGLPSLDAIKSCETATYKKWLADILAGLNNNIFVLPPEPLSCNAAVQSDAGASGPYVDVFTVTYYLAATSAGGYWIPVYYKFCDGPHVTNYAIYTQSTCPANSSPTSPADTPATCTCSDTFVADSGTSCISEPLTISLSGLGGDDVMPTKTRAAYAHVTKSDGSDKSGAHVDLSIKSVAELEGQLPVTYTGTLSTEAGTTDAYGKLPFVFTAPVAGGTHTITATCVGCTNNPVTGTIKVPGCSVDDLPPITDSEVQTFEDNPKLSDTARLTARMGMNQNPPGALRCLLAATAAGSPTVGSAFRPSAYNQHLIDVWKKWIDELKGNKEPACAALKTKIQGHFQRHELLETQQPVVGSLHTLGEAVDVTINLPAANIDALAAGCQLRRPLPVKDHVHFIHQ